MTANHALRLGATAALLLAVPSCGDFFDKLGNSDKGYFAINPTASLARGAWLTYTVRDYELGAPDRPGIAFELLGTTNDAAAHIVSASSAADLIVQGLAVGSSHVDFRGVADGKTIDDGFTLTVTEARWLSFSPCYNGGVYVRGTDGPVGYAFNWNSYPPVKGLGLYPFTVSPPDAVTLRADASTDEQWLFTIPADAPPTVTLTSSLPGDDQSQFAMTIIDASAIDGVFSTGTSGGSDGESVYINVMPSAAGVPVCIRAPRTVTSTTPSVCAFATDSGDVASLVTDQGMVKLHFVGAGTCKLTLDMGALGVSTALTAIAVSPHSSGHHHDD
jgi:hypothetical protein